MANELKHGTVGTELTQAEWEAVGAHVLDSQATGDIVYASSSSQLRRLAKGTDTHVLILSDGIPAWSATTGITGVGTITTGVWQGTDVGVEHGGTGADTLTDGGVLLGSGTGAITAMAVLADGEMIVGDGSTDPVAESGATLRTSIGVGTGDTPTFTGLTVNQGANDDEILALKSSDVGHAMTDIDEADTYFSIKKVQAGSGGALLQSFKDADDAAGLAMVLRGTLGETVDTTDTTSSLAAVHIQGLKTDGANSQTALGSTENVLVVQSQNTARLLVKGDGDLHVTNVTDGQLDGAALDNEDDIALVRAFERSAHNDVGIAMSKWDASVMAREDDLSRVGVLVGDFYSLQRMDSLLGGSIWQVFQDMMDIATVLTPRQQSRLSERLRRRLAIAGPLALEGGS